MVVEDVKSKLNTGDDGDDDDDLVSPCVHHIVIIKIDINVQ